MKRSVLILLLGVVLAGLAYGLLVGPRQMSIQEIERTCGPELAWIKTEFDLDDATFGRVRGLYEAYLPLCEEYCRQIDERHRELAGLLEHSEAVTPEIARLLHEAGELRARCQTEMLKHFLAVSRAMPPEQGRRFLAWVQQATIAPVHDSMVAHVAGPTDDDHHSH